MRVLVTGSREWADRQTVWAAFEELLTEKPLREKLVIVHGASTCADRWADEWARNHAGSDVQVERYPADWSMGKQAGQWRNQHMVNLGADLVLAFFAPPPAANRGTADCVRRAHEAGIPVRRYPQDDPPSVGGTDG